MLRPLQAPPGVPTGELRPFPGTLLSRAEVGVGARRRGLGCVVLCGGFGTRLQSVLASRPKSLAEVAGRPFLEWLLLALRRQGVTRVTLATGHLGDQIRGHLGNGAELGVRLTYSHEDTPLGTGGAVRLALEETPGDRILVLNGDTYCRLDLDRLLTAHVESRAQATLQLAFVDDSTRYGTVQVTDSGLVTAFAEKKGEAPGWISAGVCVLERSVLDGIAPGTAISIETDILPGLAEDGKLRALAGSGPFVDIGTPSSFAGAEDVLGRELAALDTPAPSSGTALVRRRLGDSIALKQQVLAQCAGSVVDAAELIASAYAAGGKLLLCGNGGSAGDCQHMAAELMSRLRSDVERRALPAVALTTDTSFLTAFANDYGYDDVFARQVEGLAGPHDVLLGISTSGNSVNVTRALTAARRAGARTIALTGDGGSMAKDADVAVEIPSRNTQLVQECMLSIEHILCELVEDALFGGRDLGGAHDDHGDAA
jgi:phosphoheptose isomerase